MAERKKESIYLDFYILEDEQSQPYHFINFRIEIISLLLDFLTTLYIYIISKFKQIFF